MVHGLFVIVPELKGSRAQRVMVLEGDLDREAFMKRWASGDKHVRSAIRSSWHSTEEEELDDEAELKDLSGEGGVRWDRSEEKEKENEVNKGDEVEEEGDEDASDEEEDDDGEDVGDPDASEGDDGEGGNGGDGGTSNSTSNSKGSSEPTPTKDDPKDGGRDHTNRKRTDSEVDSLVKSTPQGRRKRSLTKL